MDALLKSPKVWTREELLTGNSVPPLPGVYGWYFRQIPPDVPTTGCIVHNDLTLLYIGTAPKAPAASGKASRATLRSRLRQHMTGTAYGSTLRLTLGCLLSKRIGIQLRRIGMSGRTTFAAGEELLSKWIEANAFVCWTVLDEPWEAESAVISSTCLPLNLSQNSAHPFYSHLSACRAAAKRAARELPCL
jgi:hypothetical protein